MTDLFIRGRSVRWHIFTALLERIRATGHEVLLDADLTPLGWRIVLVWQVEPGHCSREVFGRCVARGLSLDEAERRLLGRVYALPRMQEAS